jgi:hypothetical protein
VRDGKEKKRDKELPKLFNLAGRRRRLSEATAKGKRKLMR